MPDPAHHQYEGELISSSYHVEEVDETRNAFEHMQGGVKNVQKEPEDVHIGEGGRLKPIKIRDGNRPATRGSPPRPAPITSGFFAPFM